MKHLKILWINKTFVKLYIYTENVRFTVLYFVPNYENYCADQNTKTICADYFQICLLFVH